MYLFCFVLGFVILGCCVFGCLCFILFVLRLGYGFSVVWVCVDGFGAFSSLDRGLHFACGRFSCFRVF